MNQQHQHQQHYDILNILKDNKIFYKFPTNNQYNDEFFMNYFRSHLSNIKDFYHLDQIEPRFTLVKAMKQRNLITFDDQLNDLQNGKLYVY